MQAVDAYRKLDSLGKRGVIIGGGTVGCELGLELAESNRDVTIVEISRDLASQGYMLYRIGLRQHMDKQAEYLCRLTETMCLAITDAGVLVYDKHASECMLTADNVILAVGMKEDKVLAHSFYGITPDTAMVGDCRTVAKVLEATNEAYFIAANL